MRWKSILVSLLIVAAVVGWMASGNIGNEAVREAAIEKEAAIKQANRREQKAFLVTVIESRAESFARQIKVNGRTQASRSSAIKAELSAKVTEINGVDGERVAAGDILVRLSKDIRPAAYASALAQLESSKKNFDAVKNLFSSGYQSELEVLRAKESFVRARQNVTQAKKALDDTTITAPYAGVLQNMAVELGDLTNSGMVVAQLIDLDPIEVVTYVSERELNQVHLGQSAKIILISAEIFEGTVHFIAPSSDVRTGTFEVRLRLANPDTHLLEGISSEVTIFTGETLAHFQSKSVLTLNDQGTVGIKAVDAQNVVAFYPVEIIEDTRDGVYLGGLPTTLSLIVVGQDFVKPGTAVRTQPQNEAAT
ncbi:MAG: efflux RND transporter periplasmic adaptor subunit [Alphaproteobacteria bacterium]|nr:efflux RND transporter periplasmic adaptor subunit [Alphaproteobacteria bacterium]